MCLWLRSHAGSQDPLVQVQEIRALEESTREEVVTDSGTTIVLTPLVHCEVKGLEHGGSALTWPLY